MNPSFRLASIALSALSAVALCACGGSSSSSSSSSTAPNSAVSVTVPVPATVSVGDPLTFTGKASSSAGAISNLFWQIETLTLGADSITAVSNADCKTVTTDSSGTSCVLSLTPPAKLSSDVTYKLSFFAGDAKGNQSNSFTTLKVLQAASITNSPVAKVGADVIVTSGDKVSLSCSGSGGTPASSGNAYAYQWVVSDAAGLTMSLTNPATAAASFVAPVVSQSTTVKLQCRVTDDKQRTGTAIQSITINPVVKPTVVPISTSGGNVQPGASASLDGSKSTMYDVNGKEVTGQAMYFLWQYKSGPAGATPLTIYNAGTSVASVVFPAVVTTPTSYTFTLNVSTAPISADGSSADPVKQRDVAFFVSALPAISVTSYNLVQSVNSGTSVQLKAETPSNTNSTVPIYFGWTQISGPAVALAGSGSQIAGFFAPTVTAPTTLQFRVSAGYYPVTVANPGTASADLIVQVLPK